MMANKNKTTEESKKVIEIHANDALPTIFVDNLMINTRSDEICFIRFTTLLPEGLKEQVRILIPQERVKRMIDALCKHCDYFPKKEKQKKESKKETS